MGKTLRSPWNIMSSTFENAAAISACDFPARHLQYIVYTYVYAGRHRLRSENGNIYMHRSSALLRKAIYNDKYYCTVYVYQCGCIMCARSYETLTSPFPLSFALVRLRRHRHFSLTASQLVQYFFLFGFLVFFCFYNILYKLDRFNFWNIRFFFSSAAFSFIFIGGARRKKPKQKKRNKEENFLASRWTVGSACKSCTRYDSKLNKKIKRYKDPLVIY